MRKFLRAWLLLPVVLLTCTAILLFLSGPYHWQEPNYQINRAVAKRKVIVLLVDSLLADSLEKVTRNNEAPALAFLLSKGQYRRDMISAFPTMSVTIDSTLLTGTYADQHRVPGLLWFHPTERRMVDYGDGLRVIKKPGLTQWFIDSFYQLNQQHLSRAIPTLHEELAANGYTSGSINGLVYRGSRTHHFGKQGVGSIRVKGPDVLALGAVATVTDEQLPDGPLHSMGMNNTYSAKTLRALVQENRLPDVTLAYFPDMDADLHKHGPHSLEKLKELDRQLQMFLNGFSSWEDALNHYVIILTGDSGVTATYANKDQALIPLEQHLSGLRFYRLGKQQQPEDDIAIAVNGRMCYIYALSDRVSLSMLVDLLKSEERIDQIAWREAAGANDPGWIHVQRGQEKMRYRVGSKQRDLHGQMWDLEGDLRVMGLDIRKSDGTVGSSVYPDGLRRLHSAFFSHAGRFLVVTAKHGFEFAADGAPNHPNGGNHGSLHASDSLLPFLVVTNGNIPSPPARVVEVKDYILSLMQ